MKREKAREQIAGRQNKSGQKTFPNVRRQRGLKGHNKETQLIRLYRFLSSYSWTWHGIRNELCEGRNKKSASG